MKLKDIEILQNLTQEFYDSFNDFIMSSDLKVFGKLLARSLLYYSVKDIPGDIVECGVFRGTGIYTFLKLKRYYSPNSLKKVIGFDYFNSDNLLSSLREKDKQAMETLFKGRNFEHQSDFFQSLNTQIRNDGFDEHEFELIMGDIALTSQEFVSSRPGAKISLLYLDLDLGAATFEALSSFWDRLSSGGIVIFDEYAFHHWSESQGADNFFKNKGITIKSLNFPSPSAYVIKP
jgi:hypothetical protein